MAKTSGTSTKKTPKKRPVSDKKNKKTIRSLEDFEYSIMNSLTSHIAILDKRGTVISVNKAWEKFAECNPPAPHHYGVGINYLEICENAKGDRAEEAPLFAKAIRDIIKGKMNHFAHEYPCNSPVESRRFIGKVTAVPGAAEFLVVISHEDITEQKLSEEALRESEEKAKAISDSSMDGIILMDGRGVIDYMNKAAEQIFGYRKEELIGKKLHETIVSKASRKKYYRRLPEFEKTGNCKVIGKNIEVTATKKNGTKFPIDLSISSFQIKGQWHSVGTVRDITERKTLEAELRTAAVTDELTGLYNRRGFFTLSEQQCKLATRNKMKMALLYLDLDDLKGINDKLGHDEGDLALIDSANVLKNSFRKSDIIGRIGGDEFAVLITNPFEEDIEAVITNNVENNLKVYNKQSERTYELSLSMGFSQFNPEEPCSIEALLTQADILMYENKQRNKKT
jgi:diguanylate cyclase (GGDEF)-like protein/PAS domain S-box-containing protein